MRRTREWRGRLKDGHQEEQLRFMEWLQSLEGHRTFGRYGLTGYRCEQVGSELIVTMTAEEPLAFIRFLRDPKMWPEFWEFAEAGAPEPAEGKLRGETAGQGRRTLAEWVRPER